VRAAALNEHDEHNYKQHSGNNPDQRGTVHCEFSFPKNWSSGARGLSLMHPARDARSTGLATARLAGGACSD
jgi:hypothetical protein